MRLSLFTVFHANLAFSSIPPGDAGRVIDRCLWPLVDAVRRPGVRLGLELPADTLATVAAVDPVLLDALGAAVAAGGLEIVGSGLVQSILPLVPAAIGERNLRRGQDVYRALLGRAPAIGYLHEQTYSAGLVPLYREAGYQAIVAEWENPASVHAWPERLRWRAAWIEGTGGARIACLWNSSVVFQRVQRYAHGEIDLEDVLGLLATHHDPSEARTLCLYGNDCEVFDYRPGSPGLAYGAGPSGEWDRLHTLLGALAADDRFALVTPSEALAAHPPRGPALRLESAAMPLPAKKQARYNVTRWAVCGRDNLRLNARCHALARKLDLARALGRAGGGRGGAEGVLAGAADELVRLWGSDLRTHTTDERLDDARRRLGALDATVDAVVARLERAACPTPAAPGEIVLFNPHPTPWAGGPVAVRTAFPPGRVRGALRVEADGRPVPAQAEEVERYRDGSWRRALVVVAPAIPPLGLVRLACTGGPARGVAPAAADERIETAAASVVLSARRGAALRALAFPRLAAGPLAGTVPQGAFAPIELAADWYSAHLVLHGADGHKHTDLAPTTLVPLAAPEECPLRVPVAARIAGPWGELWKTVWVYRDVARVDVRYHMVFRDLRPRSLVLGVLTLEPTAFRPDRLAYATVDGGRDVETFPLGAARVAQHDPVGFTVSARGCLGATEGWVDLGDDDRGVTVAWDPATLAAAPILQHEPAGERALTRLFLSLAESDETAAPLFRGHTTFTVSYLGRGADRDAARRHATQVAAGLHVLGAEVAGDGG
jgi:Glycosyl hydrolase family 57